MPISLPLTHREGSGDGCKCDKQDAANDAAIHRSRVGAPLGAPLSPVRVGAPLSPVPPPALLPVPLPPLPPPAQLEAHDAERKRAS